MSVYVFGCSNIDIVSKTDQDYDLKDSNIVKFDINFGGVGHNIAENLINLETDVKFVTLFGSDHFSQLLINDCNEKKFNLENCIFKNENQSVYISILNKDKDLFLGLNDMNIVQKLTTDDFDVVLEKITDQDIVVFDLNFPKEIMLYLFSKIRSFKIVDATSAQKIYKIENNLKDIDLLKMNVIEASRIYRKEIKNDKDLINCFKYLHCHGLNEGIITDKNGLYYSDGKKIYAYKHNANIEVVNATGAGDALISAYAKSFYEQHDLDYCLGFSLANAIFNLKSEKSVAIYNEDLIKDILLNSNIKGGVIYEY